MTDDIVTRLRAVGRDYDFHENALIYEAANEIERLRAALQTVKEWHGYGLPPETKRLIDAALVGEKAND